jgi:hypothetical protein
MEWDPTRTYVNLGIAVVTALSLLGAVSLLGPDVSPVTKTGLLVLACAGTFALAHRATSRRFTGQGYAALMFFSVFTFLAVRELLDGEATLMAFGLLGLAAVFFTAGRHLDNEHNLVTATSATYGFLVVFALALLLLGIDVYTGLLPSGHWPEFSVPDLWTTGRPS